MQILNKVKEGFQLFWRWVEMFTFRAIVALLIILCSIVLVIEPGWIVAAADSLRIPYAIFLVVFVMFFFLRTNYALASAGAIALLILAPGIWPYFKTASELPSTKKAEKNEIVDSDFSVLHFNVKENNKKITSVADAALASNADVVSMQELKESSFAIVDPLMREKYPYSLSELSYQGFGMAVYSKYPIEAKAVIASHDFPLLTGIILIKKDTLHFIAATTSTPTNDKDFQAQIKQFKFIADETNKVNGPLLVMGDMNAVPWSEQVTSLLKTTNLKDSRKDLSATYPAQSPVQIPIDYIFHSSQLTCEKFATQGGTSSNHLGIIGFYNFRDAANRKNKWK
jgi:endonuclease/exonuclease/phosphatase (EEP) superfamily protein YafD